MAQHVQLRKILLIFMLYVDYQIDQVEIYFYNYKDKLKCVVQPFDMPEKWY